MMSVEEPLRGKMTLDSPKAYQPGCWASTPPGGPSSGEVYDVPCSAGGPEYIVSEPTMSARRYCVIMVGLPARGKTFLANKLCRLLGWLGHRSAVFNVQRSWREVLRTRNVKDALGHPLSSSSPLTDDTAANAAAATTFPSPPRIDSVPDFHKYRSPRAEEYDFGSNPVALQVYRDALLRTRSQAAQFFSTKGLVALINDDFVTRATRAEAEAIFGPLCDSLFYIEVMRDSNPVYEELKVQDPDEYYGDLDHRAAIDDFRKRVTVLSAVYEPIGNDKNFIRVRNGESLEIRGVNGYIPSRMVSFLMNLSHFKVSHPIYFSRHGESMYNLDDRIGGNPPLSEKGMEDAYYLRDFIKGLKDVEDANPPRNRLQIWTSQLTRTIQTAAPSEELGITALRWSCLNEIHAGVCENLTYTEVKQQYPMIHSFRRQCKYTFRYPEGESYQDLVARLEPVIMELENADRVVVVIAHQAVLRALLAYFGTSSAESSVNVEVPHRTVWKCTYNTSGIATLDTIRLGVDTPPLAGSPLVAT